MISYSLLAHLIAWMFPTKDDRRKVRKFCEKMDYIKRFPAVQKHYGKLIEKFKHTDGKIRVLFLVNEISKWKAQSLYDLMDKSDRFEPIIAITISDVQEKITKEEGASIIEKCYDFFANKKGMNTVIAWDLKNDKPIDLKKFHPQIVFFQQPWWLAKKQEPRKVRQYALVCYIPYYVPNYGILSMDYMEFHSNLFRYYVQNKAWENFYKLKLGTVGQNIYGLGHTVLDKYYLETNSENTKHYVIYAPHWSIRSDKNSNEEFYSTFNWNGKFILEYAKSHPEINWVFKPHPKLKVALSRSGEMSDKEIENYYKEWESIATACYTSDYLELFMQSDAMITDCGSFLIEYFYSGKPLIHLQSKYNLTVPPRHIQKIFNTFYDVEDLDTLKSTLDKILLQKVDPKKDERDRILQLDDLKISYAAKNIMEDLEKVLDIKGDKDQQ